MPASMQLLHTLKGHARASGLVPYVAEHRRASLSWGDMSYVRNKRPSGRAECTIHARSGGSSSATCMCVCAFFSQTLACISSMAEQLSRPESPAPEAWVSSKEKDRLWA